MRPSMCCVVGKSGCVMVVVAVVRRGKGGLGVAGGDVSGLALAFLSSLLGEGGQAGELVVVVARTSHVSVYDSYLLLRFFGPITWELGVL